MCWLFTGGSGEKKSANGCALSLILMNFFHATATIFYKLLGSVAMDNNSKRKQLFFISTPLPLCSHKIYPQKRNSSIFSLPLMTTQFRERIDLVFNCRRMLSIQHIRRLSFLRSLFSFAFRRKVQGESNCSERHMNKSSNRKNLIMCSLHTHTEEQSSSLLRRKSKSRSTIENSVQRTKRKTAVRLTKRSAHISQRITHSKPC